MNPSSLRASVMQLRISQTLRKEFHAWSSLGNFLHNFAQIADCYLSSAAVLCNPSFPLLRSDIGDLTEKPVTETNVGFSLVGPTCRRANDFLISASGRRVDEGVLQGLYYYPIRRYRAHQFSDGKVLLLLEPGPSTNIDLWNIQRKVSDLLNGQEVEVTLSESIPLTSAGKHKVVSSDMTNPPP